MNRALVEVVKNIKNVMGKTLKNLMLCLVATIAYQANAQVTVDVDESIERNLRMKNARIDTTKMTGYRVQIAYSSDGGVANSAASKFKSKFPEHADRVYTLYQQPSYKIRVGDFKREIEAQSLLNEVRIYFSEAFVVKDYIRTPEWKDRP